MINKIRQIKIREFKSYEVLPPLLFSVWLFLKLWLNHFSFELNEFNDRIIGISSLEMIDVGIRLKTFYRALFTGITTFAVLLFLYRLFLKYFPKHQAETRGIQFLSIAGLFLLGFSVFGVQVSESLRIIFPIILMYLLSILLGQTGKSTTWSQESYFWLILSGFSLSLMLSIASGFLLFNRFSWNLSVILIASYLVLSFIPVGKPLEILKKIRLVHVYPILFIIAQEIFIIANQHGFKFINPILFSFILLAGLAIFQYFRKKNFNTERLNAVYLPLFALGLILFGTYNIQISLRNDLFEIANSSNAMMSIFRDGKFPVADFLSTHLLSDFLTPVLYTILNGYDSQFSYMAYDFIFHAAYLFIAFILILKISKKNYTALAFLLFFPFINSIFWGISSVPVLLTPLIVYRLYQKPDMKAWLLTALYSVFIIAWKPDVAVLGIYGLIAGIIIIAVKKYKSVQWKQALISFAAVYGFLILSLLALEFIFKLPVKEGLSKTLEFYASSPQARGLPVIARNFDRLFYLHHVVYPILISIIGIAAVGKLRRSNSRNAFVLISLIIFVIFYLANFQRGLTRHSFAEGQDGFISSFAVLCISLSVFLFKMKERHQMIAFVSVMSFMAIMLKFPDQASGDILNEQISSKLHSAYKTCQNEKITRVTFDPDFEQKNIKEIKTFFSQMPDGETFFDFSNTPALYYICDREMPVYFIHFLAVSSENLQEKEVEFLEKNPVKMIIFSHQPMNWWDNTDGIPNSLRFYKLSEYIFQNYSPYKIVGNYSIWKANGYEAGWDSGSFAKDSLSLKPVQYNLKYLPYLWANMDTDYQAYNKDQHLIAESKNDVLYLPEKINKEKGNYIEIYLHNPQKLRKEVKAGYFTKYEQFGEFVFSTRGEENEKHVIRISCQPNWYFTSCNRIVVNTGSDMKVSHIKLFIADE